MPINFNGVRISRPRFAGTALKIVRCNGVEVFKAEQVLLGTESIGWTMLTASYFSSGASSSISTSNIDMTGTVTYGSNTGCCNVYSNQKIDVTDFDKITFVVSNDDSWGVDAFYVGLVAAIPSSLSDGYDYFQANAALMRFSAKAAFTNGARHTETLSVDISGLTGSYYAALAMARTYTSGGVTTVKCSSIILS